MVVGVIILGLSHAYDHTFRKFESLLATTWSTLGRPQQQLARGTRHTFSMPPCSDTPPLVQNEGPVELIDGYIGIGPRPNWVLVVSLDRDGSSGEAARGTLGRVQ